MRVPVGAAVAVFRKEMIETLRDRRTLVVALVLPVVLMPVVTLGVPYLAERQRQHRAIAPSRVAIVGGSFALDLLGEGAARGLIRQVDAADPVAALLGGRLDAVVEIPPDFAARVHTDGGQVTIVFDESEARSVVARQRLQDIVAGYGARLAERRLQAHGMSRNDLTPIRTTSRSVADQRRLGGALLAGLLPFFIAIWAVLGGQHAALDTGAGERERLTLDILLVAPPSRWALALGKFLAVTTASLGSVVVVIAATLVSLRVGAAWGLAELRRASVVISIGPALWILIVSALLAAFLGAAQLALSLLARSIREAQQYFTPLYLMMTLPAMATPFLEGWDQSGWTYLAPGLGPMFALRGLLLSDLDPVHLAATVGSTGLLAGLFLVLAVRWLHQEPGSPAGPGPPSNQAKNRPKFSIDTQHVEK